MKTRLLQFIAIGSLFGASLTQVNAQSFTDPVFSPSNTVVDFGEVDSKTDPGFRVLTFKNTGNSPLMISNVAKTCGCTNIEWPKEPIKPGESGKIRIVYDVSRIGMINKTITVTTNEPDGKDADGNIRFKQHPIQLKGNVK